MVASGGAGAATAGVAACGGRARGHSRATPSRFPQVYKAREKATGKLVALKKTRLEVGERRGGRRGRARAHGRPTAAARGRGLGERARPPAAAAFSPTHLHPTFTPRWRRRACPRPPCARCRCCRCSPSPTTSSSEREREGGGVGWGWAGAMGPAVPPRGPAGARSFERVEGRRALLPPSRLLCVEHVEEHNTPVLYLVREGEWEGGERERERRRERARRAPPHHPPTPPPRSTL